MIIANKLSFSYDSTKLFDNLNMALAEKELLLIKGQNGIGKSTLLRLLAGLIPIESGTIQNNCRQSIYIGHLTGVYPMLTAEENLLNFSFLFNKGIKSNSRIKFLVREAMRWWSININSITCEKLSKGINQRIALCRLILQPSKLWLLDEPMAHLDTESQKKICQLISLHIEQGNSAIVVTHQSLLLQHIPHRVLYLGS